MRRDLEGIPRTFWQRAGGAAHRLLMLDYDGTLAPFRIARLEAQPMPRTLEALRSVTASPATRVAIVSGRPVMELDRLLGPLHATLAGEHGWEWRAPEGDLVRHSVPETTREALQALAKRAAEKGLEERLERKRASLVLHTRGLPSGEAKRLQRAFEELTRPWVVSREVWLSRVSGGLEVRSPGRDKGVVVRELLAGCPAETYPVYLGDDETDEDAFRAIRANGFGIQVGEKEQKTLARGRLPSWEAVPSFLARWLLLVEGSPSSGEQAARNDGPRRLVVVSNRLPRVSTRGHAPTLQASAGGLATAVMDALRRAGRNLWFGWNGKVGEAGREERVTRVGVDDVELAGVALTREEVDDYYLGYCNELLWPLFHSFQGKVKIHPRHGACARRMQARFAAALRPLLNNEDMVWVHDYHLLALGRELRRRDWSGPTGFFLHIPFPPYDLLQILPEPHDLLDAMMDYDVVGFHVSGYRDNYVYSCRRELNAVWERRLLTAGRRAQRIVVCPVGIDPEEFLPHGDLEESDANGLAFVHALRGRSLILGVDRLDYTKGVPERILAFERFVRENPEWCRKVVYVQVSSPSREGVAEYADQRRRVESLIGRVNGELGEHDWVPIWYLYRSYTREFLVSLYRAAHVGLVTPLRDGLNLVATEFVAAQLPESPGVLVLSRTAGAAQQMREAVIVNPYDPSDVSEGIRKALAMSIDERRERHAALLTTVLSTTADAWSRTFVQELERRRVDPAPAGTAPQSEETRHVRR